jgi:hypothetical protein
MDKLVVTPEMIEEERKQSELELLKYEKQRAINSIQVTIDDITFDGDATAQHNMSATGTIANWLFNKNIAPTLQAVADNPDTDDVTRAMLNGLADIFEGVYKSVYKDTAIGWRAADNTIHQVGGEQVLTALLASMQKVGEVIQQTDLKEKQIIGEDNVT